MPSDPSPRALPPDDMTLIQRLHSGAPEAIEEVERRYGAEMRLFCRRMVDDEHAAEDIVQAVLVACCQQPPDKLPSTSVRGWLYCIARNRCIDFRRRRNEGAGAEARGKRPSQPSFDAARDPLTTPAAKALKRDRAERVQAVLHEMDDELREVIVMKYLQDLSRDEIAEALGLTVAGVKDRLARATDWMRNRLRNLEDTGRQ